MSSSRFDVLAALILSGEATEAETIEFETMLSTSKDYQVLFEKIKRAWDTDLIYASGNYQKQNTDLWRKYQLERWSMKKKKWHQPFKVAASLALLVASSLIFYMLSQQGNSGQQTISEAKEIVKETKAGEKLKTMLPDGTIVFLNAGSQLTYPGDFGDSSRIVQLKGEGYFEVAEDKARPFTVRTHSMDVTALGTEFCVNVSENHLPDRVALVSGKLLITNVKNEQIKIDSGYTVKLSREDFSFSKFDIDYLTEVAWKDGALHFENNSFSEIVQTLELNYGVEFMMDQRLDKINDTYTGTFKNESLDNVLKVLSFSMNFNYEINGKKVLIKTK